MSHSIVDFQEVMYVLYLMVGWLKSIEYLEIQIGMKSRHRSLLHMCKFKSRVRVSLLQGQIHHIGFSPSAVTTKGLLNDNGVDYMFC